MMKNIKVNKAENMGGESFAKDEIVPMSDYSIQLPIPPNFSYVITQAAVRKNGKRIELPPGSVELTP